MHRLPGRIASVVVVTVLLFVVTSALSILWMTRALDRQASDQSETQVDIARSNLLARINLVTVDYAKWDAAFEAVQGGTDARWILDNLGSSAIMGKTVQLAVVWGGGFEGQLGWTDDGTVEPRRDLLPSETLAAAERLVSGSTPGQFEGAEFFEWFDGELFAMGVSRFEPVEHADRIPADERLGGLLLMGTRIDKAVVGDIARSLSLADARIARTPPADQAALALPGMDGKPAAYFVWDRPRPGTTMLRRMLPFLILLTAAAAALASLNMRFVRRGAQTLVLAEQHASRAARTDPLTGLPNRAAFNEALAVRARAGERAILFLDVDDFKRINDSIGHLAGDLVVADLARRLADTAGPGCLLARIGGDEFVFIVTGPEAEARARRLAKAASAALETPFNVLGHQMRIQMAMGYAVQQVDDSTGHDLVRQADLAMYEAKRCQRGAPVAFSSLLEQASRDAAVIERGLRKALKRHGELSVVYQPIFDMDGRIVRAEALARWTSPELGSVPPDRFIAVAERAGLIVEVGRKLIETICNDLAAFPDLKVSLNISPLQLMAPEFIPALVRDLALRSIDISRMEVELTESVIVDDTRLAAERLEQLHAAGFSIALDDFGTGYSSMGYLARLRFDTLKIDRSFVSKAKDSAQDAAVIDGMIRIAHGLGLAVVCEGVETAEELRIVRALGCDFAQGYLLDRPLPITALAERWFAPSDDASGPTGVVLPLRVGRA